MSALACQPKIGDKPKASSSVAIAQPVTRILREYRRLVLEDPLCPKTVACDVCGQTAAIEIIHIGERIEDSRRGETSRRLPLTVHCRKCGRRRQPWRDWLRARIGVRL
jgi:hypothetical protein